MPSDWRMGKILRWKRLMGLNRGWNRGWSWTERVDIGGGHQQRGFRIGGGPQQRVVRREQRKKDRQAGIDTGCIQVLKTLKVLKMLEIYLFLKIMLKMLKIICICIALVALC